MNDPFQSKWAGSSLRPVDISVVVPIHNEKENIEALVSQIVAAMASCQASYEIIIVDDGSDDGSTRLLLSLAATELRLRPIVLVRRYGQSTAMQAGFDASSGGIIVSLDGDLQNDPADVPRLVQLLKDLDSDVVCGWRRERHDPWLRSFLSSVANRVIVLFTSVELHDYGCTLKAYRREFVERTRLYGEMHRFLPALLSEVGARIVEEPVNHRPRLQGKSKYGFSRTLRVVLDLILIVFLRKYLQRPLHVFGGTGVLFGLLGFFILFYLSMEKLLLRQSIGDRPLLTLGVLLVVTGVILLGQGLLGELLGRIVLESGNRRQYHVRTPTQLASRDDVPPL